MPGEQTHNHADDSDKREENLGLMKVPEKIPFNAAFFDDGIFRWWSLLCWHKKNYPPTSARACAARGVLR